MSTSLFDPVTLGALQLPHRIAMAPMTRARASQPGNVANAMMAQYYAQRASAAVIIAEATQISPQGQGYSFTPGIHSDEQVKGWQLVTKAVREAGGRMILQLWHVGRMSHPSFHPDGLPVAPSALAPNATVWVVNPKTGQGEMLECPVPRALTTKEVAGVVEDYRRAAANAKAAGFDGVEIHAANGYLIDQFLHRSSNQRSDQYGGSQENRARFLLEVVQAVAGEIGVDRTGIRISPFITQRSMVDDEVVATILKAARELDRLKLAYIHIAEADWDDAPVTPDSFRLDLRAAYHGRIMVAGKYSKDSAQAMLERGLVDIVAFGRPFIANPDLPKRYQHNLALADFDANSLFGGDAEGYLTYPAIDKVP